MTGPRVLIVVQIVEELLTTAPSLSSQTVTESDASTYGVSVMEQEGVIQTRLESCSERSGRHVHVQACPLRKSKGKAWIALC